MKRSMLASVLVLVLCGIVSAYESNVSWVHGEIDLYPPSIVPDCPTTEDTIHFSLPTGIFANQWVAERDMGGTPTLSLDGRTIKLRIEGPPPQGSASDIEDPVCGLEGDFGPLEEGEWFFDCRLPGTVWIEKIVIPPHENAPVKFKANVTANENHGVFSVCYGDYFVPVAIDEVVEDPGNLLACRTSVEVCYDSPLGLRFGDKVEVYGYYYGGVCPFQYCGRVKASGDSYYIGKDTQPWSSRDVGSPEAAGSAGYDSATGTWTVIGDGHDIWDNSDNFHYVYQPLSGDGEIIARVVSVENTHPWAKAGVMIRENLSPGSKHAHLIIAPGNGCRFQLRQSTGFSSESDTPVTNLWHIRPPHWVRLVRSGNVFRAYHSDDGGTWHELVWSPQIVQMKSSVYIGLVVTSHVNGTLCTATFDNVYIVWPKIATAPIPKDGDIHPDTRASLSWTPGAYAVLHDVYFGENFGHVNHGIGGTFQGTQSGTNFVVGFPGFPFPDGLVPGTTYYWRINEVNDLNPDSPWVGDVWSFTIPPKTNPLSEALDTALGFTTGGSADWFSQTTTSRYDGDAAQSGDISHNQESWMQTTVSGAGTVKFYWKLSSEEDFDFLEFYIDGSLQDRISGLVNWQQKTYTISTSGSHTLEWRYMKDPGDEYGSDCGWVDKVEWVTTP